MITALENPTYNTSNEVMTTSAEEPILMKPASTQPILAWDASGSLELPTSTTPLSSRNSIYSGLQSIFDAINEMLRTLGSWIGLNQPTTEEPLVEADTTPKQTTISTNPWPEIMKNNQEATIPDLGVIQPSLTTPNTNSPVEVDPPGNGFTLGDSDIISDLNLKRSKKPEGTPRNTRQKEINPGSKLSSTGGFLWKPRSDKDQKLAILIPSNLTGKIRSVSILSPDKKKVLAKGRYAGIGNGSREHFRFPKAGGTYPDKAIVMITLKDGSNRYVPIQNTSQRYTK